MVKLRTPLLALLTLLAPLDAAALTVVATLPDLGAIAKTVGGPDAKVTVLASAKQDPHYIDPRPSLMLPLRRAELLLVNGLQLEQGWLPPLIQGARNPRIQVGTQGYLDTSFFVQRLQVPTTRVSRAMGDVHPGGNPHFTHDPRQGARIATAIGRRMALLDPTHAKGYLARAKALTTRLTKLVATQRARFIKLPASKRKLVSYHRSLTYLYECLKLTEVATIEPRPGIPPSPGHTAKVMTTMRQMGVRVIAQESFYPRRVSQTLARLVKGAVVVLPGGAKPGETYEARATRTVEALYAALSR